MFYSSVGSLGAAFWTSLKVAIYEGFYWGMSKISKEGMSKREGTDPSVHYYLHCNVYAYIYMIFLTFINICKCKWTHKNLPYLNFTHFLTNALLTLE